MAKPDFHALAVSMGFRLAWPDCPTLFAYACDRCGNAESVIRYTQKKRRASHAENAWHRKHGHTVKGRKLAPVFDWKDY